MAAGMSVVSGFQEDALLSSVFMVRAVYVAYWSSPLLTLVGIGWGLVSERYRKSIPVCGSCLLIWLLFFGLLKYFAG
jgi:hypothetical protein